MSINCLRCGKPLEENSTVCKYCGESLRLDAVEDFDALIRSILEEEDRTRKPGGKEGKGQAPAKEKPLRTPFVVGLLGISTLLVLALLFVMTLPWFVLTGSGTIRGMVVEEGTLGFLEPGVGNLPPGTEVPEDQVLARWSPLDLAAYLAAAGREQAKVPQVDGTGRISVPAGVHMAYTFGLLLAALLAALSLPLYWLDKRLRWMELVRGWAVGALLLTGLQTMAMKVPYLNMFALRAQGAIRGGDRINAVRITMEGIAVNDRLYGVRIQETPYLLLGVALTGAWIMTTTLLVAHYKNKELEKL
ncbi:zinc ribbon domain-containing protein [Anaerotalea alkaliphila]|uniref:Zinc ribbon domain-containing protein n=1 Tax=Anaerotalea alkaliphila TaxID=2662126 RepID=A0A7X5HVZ3_9FIRM|nr:zinc ribbon domain-containing protein [Anaerotalea alkaliphila]NDL67671.1 zinc ribbon domain-containing protein [Anaerotalea alkaliphila]